MCHLFLPADVHRIVSLDLGDIIVFEAHKFLGYVDFTMLDLSSSSVDSAMCAKQFVRALWMPTCLLILGFGGQQVILCIDAYRR